MTKAMIRAPQATTSSGWAGSATANSRPAPSVAPTTAVPRASDPVSRSAATRTSVAPTMPNVVGVNERGSRPPLMCTSARMHAKAMASIAARATRSAANVRELDRRTSLSRRQHVMRHAVGHQVRAERGRYVAYGHDEDAVMRAAERDGGVGQGLAEPRGDYHERRAPGQAPAFAEKHRLGRTDGVRPEARQDLEAAGERPRSAPKRRAGPFMGEVVDAVRHEPDLPAGRGGEAHELGGGRNDELGGLGVGLYPVLLVGRDVHQEDRIEARRGFIKLGVKLAKARRCLPVDLLVRIAAAVRTNAAEPKWIGHEPAPRGRLGEGTERRERAIAHREKRGVRDDLWRERYGPLDLRESEPVAGAQAKRTDGVGAASRDAYGQAHDHPLTATHREPAVDPSAWRSRCGIRRLDALTQKEARFKPRERHRLAVDDLDRRDR